MPPSYAHRVALSQDKIARMEGAGLWRLADEETGECRSGPLVKSPGPANGWTHWVDKNTRERNVSSDASEPSPPPHPPQLAPEPEPSEVGVSRDPHEEDMAILLEESELTKAKLAVDNVKSVPGPSTDSSSSRPLVFSTWSSSQLCLGGRSGRCDNDSPFTYPNYRCQIRNHLEYAEEHGYDYVRQASLQTSRTRKRTKPAALLTHHVTTACSEVLLGDERTNWNECQ